MMGSETLERMRRTLCLGALAVLAAAGLMSGHLMAQEAAPADGAAKEEAAQPAPPGEIRFLGKNKIARADSVFHQWRIASLTLNRDNLTESSLEIEVDVASLDTGIVKRDDHLRSADFFDVATYPTATIRVYDVHAKEGAEANRYVGKLDLTIRDVTKTREIEFDVIDPETMKVGGELTVLRTDFGVGEPHKSLNPMSVEDEVHISFEATLDPVPGEADPSPAS